MLEKVKISPPFLFQLLIYLIFLFFQEYFTIFASQKNKNWNWTITLTLFSSTFFFTLFHVCAYNTIQINIILILSNYYYHYKNCYSSKLKRMFVGGDVQFYFWLRWGSKIQNLLQCEMNPKRLRWAERFEDFILDGWLVNILSLMWAFDTNLISSGVNTGRENSKSSQTNLREPRVAIDLQTNEGWRKLKETLRKRMRKVH